MLTICFHAFSLCSLALTTAPAAKGMEMVPRCVRSCRNREIKIYLYTHPMLFPFTLALALALALSHSAALQQACYVTVGTSARLEQKVTSPFDKTRRAVTWGFRVISPTVMITPYLSRDTTYCYRHCKGISRFPLLLHHPSPRPMPDRTFPHR